MNNTIQNPKKNQIRNNTKTFSVTILLGLRRIRGNLQFKDSQIYFNSLDLKTELIIPNYQIYNFKIKKLFFFEKRLLILYVGLMQPLWILINKNDQYFFYKQLSLIGEKPETACKLGISNMPERCKNFPEFEDLWTKRFCSKKEGKFFCNRCGKCCRDVLIDLSFGELKKFQFKRSKNSFLGFKSKFKNVAILARKGNKYIIEIKGKCPNLINIKKN